MVDDRCQRRRDVLEASTNLLHEGGWAALTMREVAARTGVSAGALYQWFDGKDEIYAELFTARLNRGIAQFDAMPDDLPFDDVLASMLRWVQTTWTTLACWQLDCSEIARGREPGQRSALSEAYRHILEVGSVKLQAAAEREGRRFLDDLDTMHMIWGIAAGIAQRAEILQMETERVDQMMASRPLAQCRIDRIGLTETVTAESAAMADAAESPDDFRARVRSWYDEHATPRTETDPWAVNVHTDHETEHHHFELSRNWQGNARRCRPHGDRLSGCLRWRRGAGWMTRIEREISRDYEENTGFPGATTAMLAPALLRHASEEQSSSTSRSCSRPS